MPPFIKTRFNLLYHKVRKNYILYENILKIFDYYHNSMYNYLRSLQGEVQFLTGGKVREL